MDLCVICIAKGGIIAYNWHYVGKYEKFIHQALKYSAAVLPNGETLHQILKIRWNLKRFGD